MSEVWSDEQLWLAHLAGVEVGPEKFGLPSDTDFNEFMYREPHTNPKCKICGLAWSCHRIWVCMDYTPDERANHAIHGDK